MHIFRWNSNLNYVVFLDATFLFLYLDEDNWIVDDEGQPISKGKKKKKHIIHEDA